MPASRMKIAIAHILKQEGFVSNYRCIRDGKQGLLKVTLKYRDHGASKQQGVGEASTSGVIREIKRISSPGCRRYVGSKDIPLVKNGFGIVVLSTSQGVMTDREARRRGTGGELLVFSQLKGTDMSRIGELRLPLPNAVDQDQARYCEGQGAKG